MKRAHGFTIVELLIVIVVIGILAGISIVAYGNISDRARESSAHSAASQAAKQVAMYEVRERQLPSTLSDIDLTNDGSTSYQYSSGGSGEAGDWCLTATTGNKSFHVSSAARSPQAGGCTGHDRTNNDGSWTVWGNLANNASFESTDGWNFTTSRARVQIPDAKYGDWVVRLDRTSGNNHLSATPTIAVEPGKTYRISAWVRKTTADSTGLFGHYVSSSATPSNTTYSLSAIGQTGWTELTATVTANASSMSYMPYISAGTTGVAVLMDGVSITPVD